MKLSIIIPVFYCEEIFEKCLMRLVGTSGQHFAGDWELLAYNNGFDPKHWQELSEIYPQLKFYGGGENLGFAKANNVLIEKAQGEYILLLNQDVYIEGEAVEAMLDFLEKNPEYACVAPQLKLEDGTLQHSCRAFPKGFWFLAADLFTGGKMYQFHYDPTKSQEVNQPMASCLLFQGEAFKKLGGFDDHPHFFLYFNDVDLSYRLRQSGGKSYFLASVSAYHLHGHSSYLHKEMKRLSYWGKGLGRFWYKTGSNYFLAYLKAFIVTFFSGLRKIIKAVVS